MGGFRKNRLHYSRRLFFVILLALMFSGLPAKAGTITSSEKKAYLKVAEHVPASASFSILATDLRSSIESFDRILRKYQTVDPLFRYDQFVLTLKGGIGYNPLSADEFANQGIDLNFGLAFFSLTQGISPLVIFRATDPAKVEKVLHFLAGSMGQAKPCPEVREQKLTVHYFSSDGTPNGIQSMAYAVKGDMFYLMGLPPGREWFGKHLKAAIGLKKNKSLAADKSFVKLLGRLDARTSLISYNNYRQYLKDLKRNTKEIGKQLQDQMAPGDIHFLDMMDEISYFAEGFTAQIFGLSIQADRVSFVYEIIGPVKKMKEFHKLFSVSGKERFDSFRLFDNSVGVLYGKANAENIVSYLSRRNKEFTARYAEWKKRVMEEIKLDLEKDLVKNANGEMAVAFYGLSDMPDTIKNGSGVTEAQMMSLPKLVFFAALRNPERLKKLLNKVEIDLGKEGESFSSFKGPGGSHFVEVRPDGLPIQFGVHEGIFMLGIGRDAVKAAFGGATGAASAKTKNMIGNIKVDFTAFIRAMEKLKPPINSPNTQLHQQYRIWSSQARPKLQFMKDLEISAVKTRDGFRTSGELRF